MDLISIPLLSPFNYDEWKLNMVAYLKSHDLFDVSIGSSEEYYEEEHDWLNYCDKAYGGMGMVMSTNMRYWMDSVEYPFNIWRNLDKYFGVQKEEDNS